MLDEQARTFLQAPRVAYVSTVGPDGYPHTVPVWFMLDGDEVVLISERSTHKVRHIQSNPKGALTVGGQPGDGAGYLIRGDFSIEEDPDRVWLKKMTYHYEQGEEAERDIAAWGKLDMIVIRLKPRSISRVI
jgi:PPOX class probable F420-dependent enzyme